MAVKIRLRRMGANKRPFYRVVVSDGRPATTGRFIETIGWYNPLSPTAECRIKTDRLAYWQGVGAQLTPNVKALVKRAKPYESEPVGVPSDDVTSSST